MITPEEVIPKLAALFFYGSADAKKGESFEKLEDERKKPFISLAVSALLNLDKLNLTVVPKSTKNQEEVETLLRARIEAEVKAFFDRITIWKKGAIPQAELAARIYQIWERL